MDEKVVLAIAQNKAAEAGSVTQEKVTEAVSDYITDNPSALNQSAVEAIVGDRIDDIVLVQNTQPTEEDNKIWIPNGEIAETQVPTYEDFNQLKNSLDTATDGDIGKALSPKTVTGGHVTEWQFKSIGGGGGGTSDYSELENKPQINGVTLAGNKSLADLGVASASDVAGKYTKPVSGIPANDLSSAVQASLGKADTALQGQDVTSAVDNYLEANFSNPSNPPLDRTLTSSLSAAPADMVGEIKSALSDTGIISETDVSFPETNTYYSTSGIKQSNASSVGTGFVAVNKGDIIKFKLAEHSSFATIAFYTSADQSTFISGSAVIGSSSTLTYVESSVNVPSTAKYMRAGSWDATQDCYLQIVSILDVGALSDTIEQNTEDITTLETDIEAVEESVETKMGSVIDISKPFPNQGYINSQGKIAGQSYTTYVTDFIMIEDTVSSIKYNLAKVNSALMIAFYTSADQNTYISGSGIEGTGSNLDMNEGETTIPSGAKYFRAAQWEVSGANYYVKKVYTLKSIIDNLHGVSEKENVDSGNIETLMLMESINKPFVFASKTVTAFGDSITYGIASPNLSSTTPYIKLFTNHVGATLNNQAISGTCIGGTSSSSIKNKVLAFSEITDFIVIAGGTNDYNSGITLGTFGSVDSTDFYGALEAICTYLQTNYSSTPVIFITPIPYTNKAVTLKNSVGKTLNDYRRAIYQVATKYGYSVVDGASLGMPTSQGGWGNFMCDDTDGCHPTADGHKLMARSLAGKLC